MTRDIARPVLPSRFTITASASSHACRVNHLEKPDVVLLRRNPGGGFHPFSRYGDYWNTAATLCSRDEVRLEIPTILQENRASQVFTGEEKKAPYFSLPAEWLSEGCKKRDKTNWILAIVPFNQRLICSASKTNDQCFRFQPKFCWSLQGMALKKKRSGSSQINKALCTCSWILDFGFLLPRN